MIFLHDMIFDCLNFYNEFELLDIRLNTLDDVIDKFIIVESTVTFTNNKKPLYFDENKNRFKKFLKKIIHIKVNDSPDVSLPWIIEHHQLSACLRGLRKAKPEDTILVSCVDEIPNPGKIIEWKDRPGKYKVFLQKMSYYFLNYECYNSRLWYGTQMYKYKDLLTFPDPYTARFTKPDVEISDGGWHFSYIGGVRQIQRKLASFSHQEYNNDAYNTAEGIRAAILHGEDFMGKGLKFRIASKIFLPKYVLENQKKFKNLLLIKKPSNIFSRSSLLRYLYIKQKIRILTRMLRRTFLSSRSVRSGI